ncbi:hypothetical protein Ancab_018500 [Ancistrocladus abbreviatus]
MKRQHDMPNEPTTIDGSKTVQKKRLKTTVEKQHVMKVEEKEDNRQDLIINTPMVAAVVADGGTTGCYEWPWVRKEGGIVVDEQMSWGAMWFPSWDVDFMGEDSYHALYMDVIWDDDIWDLRSINQVPTP